KLSAPASKFTTTLLTAFQRNRLGTPFSVTKNLPCGFLPTRTMSFPLVSVMVRTPLLSEADISVRVSSDSNMASSFQSFSRQVSEVLPCHRRGANCPIRATREYGRPFPGSKSLNHCTMNAYGRASTLDCTSLGLPTPGSELQATTRMRL